MSPSAASAEAGRTRAAHAERVPAAGRRQGAARSLHQHNSDLVGRRRVGGASGGGNDAVAFGAVGHDGGGAREPEALAFAQDRGVAGADVAPRIAFRRRGGEQQLAIGDPAQQVAMPGLGLPVPDHAGERGGVHRHDHRRRGAGLTEDIADFGEVAQRRPVAAENLGDHRGEEAVPLRLRDRIGREDGVAIDDLGPARGDDGHRFGAQPQRRREIIVGDRRYSVEEGQNSSPAMRRKRTERKPTTVLIKSKAKACAVRLGR